ncbi:hypothetical protein [Candidatus Protochlamydia phocaeensis]|uniref:hypothetical protein n=1 Tax=Candidatus Protochlamydia phocaeensis TaxID=1414722 RepID=UPI000839658A|nr:hypothetical protein [Candidatus Protochlamydia phocaeensis]
MPGVWPSYQALGKKNFLSRHPNAIKAQPWAVTTGSIKILPTAWAVFLPAGRALTTLAKRTGIFAPKPGHLPATAKMPPKIKSHSKKM